MPISRYQIGNVYSLADPELYKAADKDDPEALLEGVAMAGLVGVLRQLGDLAEFAAKIFDELHEDMTATASRSHGLLTRVQQLELEIPSIERAYLSQTCHSAFFPNSGIDWHPNRQTSQNLITTGDLPRFVMDSYEECHGPPQLFLLDKFDVGGAGACLKRYTDPSIYKVEVSLYETQRDKKIHKTKKKGSSDWKGGGTHKVSQPSHVKLHQLLLEDSVENGTIEPTRRVKLKKRPNKFPFDSETGQSYMTKLLNSPSGVNFVHELPVSSSIIPLPSDRPGIEIFEDTIGSDLSITSPSVSSSIERTVCRDLTTSALSLAAGGGSFAFQEEVVDEKQITVDKTNGVQNGYQSDDVASETENYVDALATMESELETEGEVIPKTYSDRTSDSPPRSKFASTEILFRPWVPHQQVSIDENICGTQHFDNPNSPTKNEEPQIDEEVTFDYTPKHSDFLSTCDGLSSFKFVTYSVNEHHNDGFSPMIHLPSVLETSHRIREDGSVHSRCGSLNSVISCEDQLKETGDDVLHIFDSAEAKFSHFSHYETETNKSEVKEKETESDHGSVPDGNDNNALSTLEDDTETQNGEQENEDKVDPQLLVASGSSELLSQSDSRTHETHFDTHSEPYPNLSVQSVIQKEIPQGKPMTVSESESVRVPDTPTNGHDIDLFDQVKHQFHPDPYSTNLASQNVVQKEDPHGKPVSESVPELTSGHDIDLFDQVKQQFHPEPYSMNLASQNVVQKEDPLVKPMTVSESQSTSENLPTMDLPQENNHNIELFDQVKHQSPPVFPVFGVHPELPPVKMQDMPPLPPLPPMQWRTRKLESPLLTPTYGGPHSNGNFRFPVFFQSKSDEGSKLAGPPSINEIKNLDTENQKFEHEPTLHTKDEKSSESSEAKFAENLDPQAAVETHSGPEIVYSNPPCDEMLNSIWPIKIQQPRSPLIDAVATHDKSKLRKVSDRAMPHILRREENNILLEQIRAKSFKLKPTVQTRPSIQSPTTNVRLAAILEKANAIRQAFAGSDDESDSWSD